MFFLFSYPREGSFWGYIKNHSIRTSVCVRFVTSFGFEIGIPYLAHGFMRQCVAYIHDSSIIVLSLISLQGQIYRFLHGLMSDP